MRSPFTNEYTNLDNKQPYAGNYINTLAVIRGELIFPIHFGNLHSVNGEIFFKLFLALTYFNKGILNILRFEYK